MVQMNSTAFVPVVPILVPVEYAYHYMLLLFLL